MLSFKSIKGKMIFGFSVVVALIVLLGGYIFFTLNNVNKDTEGVKNIDLPLLIANQQLAQSMDGRLAASRGFILTGDDSFIERYIENRDLANKAVETVREIGASKEFDGIVEKGQNWDLYIENDVFNEYKTGNKEVARKNLLTSTTDAREIRDGYTQLAVSRQNDISHKEESLLASGKVTVGVVVGIIIFVIILSMVTAWITSISISKPLRKVMSRMRLIADGDLSAEPLETKLRDEIGQLVTATNEMSHNTRNLLSEINEVSETVSSQSEELTQSANEVKAGTEQISVTMEEIARGTESQAMNTGELSTMMESFVMKVTEANGSGEHIQKSSNTVLSMTTEGSNLMKSSTEQMAVIDEIVHNAVIKVEGLDQHAQQISELVSVIQDIAGQTNLLALNAAIEAARAGEHGKGFAVVADEVRKLAEQSSVSVTNITEIVDRIQSESSSVVASLLDGYKEVEQGTYQITMTGETFRKISLSVTEMVDQIYIVSNNLSDIAENSHEMSSSIQEIAAISEESAAGVEQTSASSEQASSAMEEVANSSNDLAMLAENLNGLVRQFKL
ncbi:HAMP domain-containing protein [Sporosarcina sp. BI001-red]|uniref:methyl-accepting chemotaxis protein n=1 Tax=Sporosarcina sp. BI001-red TaxID=2282866 RepID=UPI000E25EA15|nr:methyl-accepting chemotaxis protein [Sporosarcina sp. BI001-red]REB08537.1 HAMP domain-containing protein [Sporosarcina sp. BI001-red]